MLRFSIIASLLLITAVTIKSNLGSSSPETKPVKLSGFSVSRAVSRKAQPLSSRRTTATSLKTTLKTTVPQPNLLARKTVANVKPPIQSLAPEQKIERAKQAWENIRSKALDHLRVDQSTRETIEQLRAEYAKSGDPLSYSDYQQKLKETLGEQNFAFLLNARESFKSRVYQRAQIEVGPHLGVL